MFTNSILKSVSFWNGLFVLVMLSSLCAQSQDFDPFYYNSHYPNEDFVLLKHNVDIELLDTEEGVVCKTKHRKEYLTLEENVYTLNRFLLTFSETQQLKVTTARVYQYEDGKKKLINNVKTKWLKARDHYIKGVFFNDIKDYEIATSRVLGMHTHITIEYEVIDNDLKFINPIYVSDYGEHVVDFSINLMEPYDAIIDLVPFNIEKHDFIYTDDDGFTRYKITDLASIEEDGNTPPYNYIAPHFVPVVRAIGDKKLLASTADLYAWYKGLISEVAMNSIEVSSLATELINGAGNDEEKIERIFKYVQAKIDYLAFEDGIAGFKPASAKEVLHTGYGDCKGMSNLLVDLLRNAGVEAGHAWIGTRRLNYTYDLAALCVDNHMVCWVKYNGSLYILDATGKNHLWNRVPSHLQGKQMLLGQGESFEIVTVPILEAAENKINLNAVVEMSATAMADIISGSIVITGNEAIDYFMSLQNLSVQSPYASGEWIVYNFLDGSIDEVRVEELNYDDKEHELAIQFRGTVTGSKVRFGNTLYFYPKFSQHLIEISDPKQPAYFNNAFVFKSSIDYELENGLSIQELPSPIELNTETFALQYGCTKSGAKINETRSIQVNTIYSDASKEKDRTDFMTAYRQSFKLPFKLSN